MAIQKPRGNPAQLLRNVRIYPSRLNWDVETQGLFGAPELHVIVGEDVHVTVLKALSVLGLGRDRIIRAPVAHQGRIKLDTLPELDDRSLICAQCRGRVE